MIRRPPRSTLFPTRRSSDLVAHSTADRERVRSGLDPLTRLTGENGESPDQVTYADLAPTQRHRPSGGPRRDRKSTRLNSSHANISYAVFCLKKTRFNRARPH